MAQPILDGVLVTLAMAEGEDLMEVVEEDRAAAETVLAEVETVPAEVEKDLDVVEVVVEVFLRVVV